MLNVISKNCINLFSWMNPDFDIIILVDMVGMTDERFKKFKKIAEEAYEYWFHPDEETTAYYSGIGDYIRTCLAECFEPKSFEIYFKEKVEE